MIKVLADADLVLELFLKRPDFCQSADKVLRHFEHQLHNANSQETHIYITDKCFSEIRFYLTQLNYSVQEIDRIIDGFERTISSFILKINKKHIEKAFELAISDMNSAVELVIANEVNCQAVVTLNPTNFMINNSSLRIVSPDNLSKLKNLFNIENKLLTIISLEKLWHKEFIPSFSNSDVKYTLSESEQQRQKSKPKNILYTHKTINSKKENNMHMKAKFELINMRGVY